MPDMGSKKRVVPVSHPLLAFKLIYEQLFHLDYVEYTKLIDFML